jgi:Tol biopolymer transport system component
LSVAGKRFAGLFAGLVLSCASVFAVSSAQALSPPPEPKAEIVFENAGRIMSMKADGSERKVLTGKGNLRRYTKNNNFGGDMNPQISPDGKHLLFERLGADGPNRRPHAFMVADRNGSNARVLHRYSKRRVSLSDPSWSPDSQEVIFHRESDRRFMFKSSVIAIGLDGKMRTVAKLKPVGVKKRFTWWYTASPVMSPDGGSLLVKVEHAATGRSRLDVIDLKSGKRRILAWGGMVGSWSPDGSRVVMSAQDLRKKKRCPGCYPEKIDLEIIDSDGANRRLLYRSSGVEANPHFSPGGDRIVFESNRNYPSGQSAKEIYTIAPDGKCLTWLTNGTPASIAPFWGPETGRSTSPGECGPGDREPLLEFGPVANPKAMADTQVWLGPAAGSLLASEGSSRRWGVDMEYGDCAFYEPTNCEQPLYFGTLSQCMAGISLFALGPKARRTKAGGKTMWTVRHGKGIRVDFVLTGKAVAYVLTFGRNVRPGGRYLKDLATIRGNRPAAVTNQIYLSAKAQKRLRMVRGILKRTGSVAATATALKMSRRAVRNIVRAERQIKRAGGAKTMRCAGKRSGRSSEGRSSSDSAGSRALRNLIG